MSSSKTFWQTTFVFTFLTNLTILVWSISRWAEIGVILYRSVWGIALLLYLAVLAGCVFLFFWIRKSNAERLVALLELERLSGPFWRGLSGAVFTGILLLIPWLKFTFRVGEVVKKSTQDPVLTMILFYWACWWLILIAAGALKVAFRTSWQGGFASALVMLGVAYEIFVRFHAVSSYPFSLGWSETSRYYYASLYFSKSLYGENYPLSPLHPTRYLLQSLAFLIPGLDLTAHRFWQFLLWILLTGGAAVTLAWRALTPTPLPKGEGRRGEGFRWLFAGWFFLYLLRVGVYYHLEVMVIVPLLFVSVKHSWRSLAAVIFASVWAGVSRVNWFPVPAMIATAIYLLELPVHHKATKSRSFKILGAFVPSWLSYLKFPVLWAAVGLLSALAAQAAYIPLSGNAENAGAFTSSFTSELLPYRLWPNELYPLGILPAILVVSGPLIIILILAARRRNWLHPIRWIGLWGMILILFAGSLVVSTKIGGGGDLHNMDAYAVLIGIVAAHFIGDKVARESEQDNARREFNVPWPVTAVAVMIPVIFLIPSLFPLEKNNLAWNQSNVEQLKKLVEGANGPVLFITERHFVTFKTINVPLVPEYERVTLMEAAMSGNAQLLEQFYTDLREHRFAMIVSGKENLIIKEDEAFAEENNVWNQRISPYILCYYEPVALIEPDYSRLEVFVPRATPGVCAHEG
jgi:hypothetical protein